MELKREAVSGIMLIILLAVMSTLVFKISHVCADVSWVWVRDTVTGAYGEAVVGTGKALYIARGTSFYRYLPADDGWTELASPPEPDGYAFKTGTALAWDFGEYIYALCGATTGDSRRWFFRYSISTDSWETLANTTADQGEGNALTWVSVDNCIYATIGGEQRPTYFVRYDPLTNSWSDAPADPPAGMGDGASLVWTGGDSLYALRGEFFESEPLYDFWLYNLADNAWTAMADIPALPHSGGTGGVGDGGSLLYAGFWLPSHQDYIYALSGNQAHPDGIPDNRTYRYTISTNTWELLADLPFGVGYYVGCRLGYAEGHIYAWQGAPSTWTGGGDDLAKYRLAWIVDDDGPADFHIIQEAINAASAGDTVSVRNGTYYENNILVNKGNISLVGENRETTIIDGGKTGGVKVLVITEDNVTVTGFTIKSSIQLESGPLYIGIALDHVRNCNISGNKITNNNYGIELSSSFNSTIAANNITENGRGIRLAYSENNSITDNDISKNGIGVWLVSSDGNGIIGNNITDNRIAIWFSSYSSHNSISENNVTNNCWGIELLRSSNNSITDNIFVKDGLYVDESYGNVVDGNVVNGKPLVYLEGVSNRIIEDAGQVILVNCNAIRMENLEISNTTVGVELWTTSNSEITGNHISTNTHSGIWLVSSSNNSIYGNTIKNSNIGIRLYSSSSNKIFHNNFMDNWLQAYVPSSSGNLWDNGYPSGGNYWSDYTGVDDYNGPYQDMTGSDGIGDTTYDIDAEKIDRYPLMAPFNTFDAGTWNGEAYSVDIISNSTPSDFKLNVTQKTLSFNVTGIEGKAGFCRVTIPNVIVEDLWHGNFTVLLNGEPWPFRNWTDPTNIYIYVNYTHSEHEIAIVPEFPSVIFLSSFMMVCILAVVFAKRKLPRKPKS